MIYHESSRLKDNVLVHPTPGLQIVQWNATNPRSRGLFSVFVHMTTSADQVDSLFHPLFSLLPFPKWTSASRRPTPASDRGLAGFSVNGRFAASASRWCCIAEDVVHSKMAAFRSVAGILARWQRLEFERLLTKAAGGSGNEKKVVF